ncbi:MAG: isoprenyl transferase [Clostridia bacterium]|nr:isoprenyl transferase [Clostridia bacterium]
MLFGKQEDRPVLDKNNIPVHIAAIMDGNGRWAQKRGLPRTAGHSAGSEAFQRAAEYLQSLGVKYFTVYAFSTENWKRPEEEVQAIMGLLDRYLRKAIREMAEKNIRLHFFGDLEPLSDNMKKLIAETNEISRGTTGMQVNVCLNYGGRDEIVRAVRSLARDCARDGMPPEAITEELFSSRLYSANIPDPDLTIRPGGELRLSNFLLWQNAYSEFYFTDTLWPDMDEAELDKAIAAYQGRKRRFGGI